MFSNKRNCLGVRGSISLPLAMLLLFCMPLCAQATTDTTAVAATYELDMAVATASRQRFRADLPVPAQILSGKELERFSSLSVADAIRYFSGVQLKDYGGVGGLKTVNVRSLGSAHTAVFYDGAAVANAQNGQVDLGKFSLDNVEAVELYNGQKPSIFQPARGFFSSNTLLLRSKTPFFPENKSYNVKATCKAGSFGLVNPALLYQQKLSSVFALSANLEWLQANGKYKYRYAKDGGYDTTAVRQNGDITALRAELGLHIKVGDSAQATLKAYLYDSERGLPGAIVANRFSHTQRLWDRNFFIHGSLQKNFSDKYQLLANLKYGRDYNRYVDPDYVTTAGVLDNRYYQNELYTSLANRYSIRKWWDVSLATDFVMNTLNANLYRFSYPTRYSYLGALSTQMKWDRLNVQASLLTCYVDEQVKYYQQGDSRKVFCPVISASVQPFSSSKFRVRAFYKESFRMPTFNDLYYTFIGNSSLQPEFTTQYDVGATWLLKFGSFLQTISLQADAYYNQVTDKIVAIPSSNLFRWTMMNLGKVEIKGIEANAAFGFHLQPNMLLDLGLSYTYQKAVDVTSGSSVHGDQIPYTPLHSGTVTSSLEWKDWRLNYSCIYTGERYSQKANIPVNYVQPWYTSDVALSWQCRVWKQNVRLLAEVSNLFNQYYDVILNFPMPGRSYRFSISINI